MEDPFKAQENLQLIREEATKIAKNEIQTARTQAGYGPSLVPYHTHNQIDSPAVSINRYFLYRVVAPETDDDADTTVGGDLVMPFNGFIFEVGATVDTAGTTGTMALDINKNGTSIISTKITIDSGEKTSRTAAIPFKFTLPQTTFKIGDIFTFDIDTEQTTVAKGLTFFMNTTQLN